MKNILKTIVCALVLTMLFGFACAEEVEITSNDTIYISVDDLKAAGVDTITFDFDFSNGSWGGGCVGYNGIAEDGSAAWTSSEWSNAGTTSITVDVDDLWVNTEDPTDTQNIQVQVWWNAGEELPVTLTITKIGTLTFEIVSNDTIFISVDDLKAKGIETLNFDFDFSNGSWGGGCVGYNGIAEDGSNVWTASEWANGQIESVRVSVDDLWVNTEDPTDTQNIQVQVWWNAGEELPITLTVTMIGDFNVVDDTPDDPTPTPEPEDPTPTPEPEDPTPEATPSDAEPSDDTPATGDAGIIAFVMIAVVALAGVVVTKKVRA
ncbi:MAG: hypothetical protein ACI39R_02990 [Lachnospiraceae bacterium]